MFKGKISNITNFGAFITIGDGVDGLLHVSDISWTEKVDHPSDKYSEGDEVEVKVLAIDNDARKISLGVKQLSDDPIEKFLTQNPIKAITKASVKEVSGDGSLVLDLGNGVEGHVVPKQAPKDIEVGAEVSAKVLEFSHRDLKVYLSIKQAERDLERGVLEEHNKSTEVNTSSESKEVLGDLASLKAELEKEERERHASSENKKSSKSKGEVSVEAGSED